MAVAAAPAPAPLPSLGDRARLLAVLDALLELGRGEVLLHNVPRGQLVVWAGIHGLGVACDEDVATRVTRVLHRDGRTLCWSWEARP